MIQEKKVYVVSNFRRNKIGMISEDQTYNKPLLRLTGKKENLVFDIDDLREIVETLESYEDKNKFIGEK